MENQLYQERDSCKALDLDKEKNRKLLNICPT